MYNKKYNNIVKYIIHKYNIIKVYLSRRKQAKQLINLLLLNNFYPVISYQRVHEESDELFCTVWSLVTVRNQLPAQRG